MQGWRLRGVAALALFMLAGCANGDFGEVRREFARDDTHDWIGRAALSGQTVQASPLQLTDDERLLRDLAYPLIEPPYRRQMAYSIAGEYGVIGASFRTGFDRTAYTTHLMGSRYSSSSARYAQLTDDIRNDITRIPQFFETAARVLDIDRKRRKSLAYIHNASAEERDRAMRRIRENASIVGWVRTSLSRRAASYHFALERLVMMTPSSQAVEVERALNQLKAETARHGSAVSADRGGVTHMAFSR